MDADRFDALSRALSTGHSRRTLTRLLGGLSLGGVLTLWGRDAVSAALRNGGARCTTKSQCKTGRCLNPDQCDCTKTSCSCTCACSASDPIVRCIAPPNPCKKAVCSATGRCVTRNKCSKQAPETCGRTGACANGTCLRYGTTAECGVASCSGGSTLVRQLCDGNGTCTPQEEPCVREEPETCGQTGVCEEGTCELYRGRCGPLSCDVNGDQVVPLCDGEGNCVEETFSCDPDEVCGDGLCKQPNGEICESGGPGTECISGFCVRGRCCESACTGPSGSGSCPGGTCACSGTFVSCNNDGACECDVDAPCNDGAGTLQCVDTQCVCA